MAKDYKHVSEARLKSKTAKGKPKITKSSNKSIPGWLWMVSGLLIGSFVSFLVFLKMNVDLPVQESQPEAKAPVVQPEKPPVEPETAKEVEKDRFEFYTILPKREVTVPEVPGASDETKSGTSESVSVPPKVDKNVKYLLQAGSFYRFKDADRRKANLALMGVTSKIYVAEQDSDKTLYRVRIGPYDNMQRINEIEAVLKQNKIPSLLLQVRG